MPAPATTAELIERIRKSGLVPPAELQGYLATPRPGPTPHRLLDGLVEAHLLTRFQADRLAAGKYKGFVLGSYTILDRLGAGGMGQVFLAEHAAMRRFVALKVLPGNVYEDDIARERFFREARAAATLDHPNIVRVFDMNREGKLLYLVMEYVEGASLQTIVEQDGQRTIAAAASYAQQMAHGLQHAHERGLVHRDIKPGNTLVDRAGVARLLDLGLVRSESDGDSKLTANLGGRSILGTLDYLAPEQALDSSNVDIRADIYSLGATLYFLLAGHPVFPEGRAGQKLMWQQWRDPTPIDRLRPDVPAALAAIVHRALAKKREERFQTPSELAEALAPWVAGLVQPIGGLIHAPPYRPFLGRGATAAGNDHPSKRTASAGTSRNLPEPKPTLAVATATPVSGVVRLDNPFELDQATPIALGSADTTTVEDRPLKRTAAPARIDRPPTASRRVLVLVSAITALVVGFMFITLAALLFAFGVIRT